MMTIYERIRAKRQELGLSQDELAKKLGYTSRSTINKIESGLIDISQSKIVSFAEALHVTPAYLMGWDEKQTPTAAPAQPATGRYIKGVKIPVLGKVVAGMPLEAVENIEGYEEITPTLAAKGDFFALRVEGKSMEPYFLEDDIVIVRKQSCIESGAIAIVLINGDEATVKKVKLQDNGLTLIGYNTAVYEPHFYSNEEVAELPIQIIGEVVESKRMIKSGKRH